MKHKLMPITIAALLAMNGISTAGAIQPSKTLADRALERVAARTGRPLSELRIANSTTAQYPLSGKTAVAFKILGATSATMYGVTLDAQGQEVDEASLLAGEYAAYQALYGRLDPALANALVTAPADTPIRVVLWLKQPAYTPPTRPEAQAGSRNAQTAEEREAFAKQVDAQRAAVIAPVVAPIVDRLARLGYPATAEPYSPMVYTQLPPRVIRQVGAWAEVERIYLAGIAQADLDVARATIFADVVNNRGITGTGIKVGQIEVEGRVATSNPYLSGVTQDTQYVCSTATSHSTGVAGIIRSTDSVVRGIALGVSLWAGGSCQGYVSELQNRATAAADWGARALNLSFGMDGGLVPGSQDRFYDDLVLNRYRTVVAAAGNQGGAGCGQGTNGNVHTPGTAYNVLTVGNFKDWNAPGWTADMMEDCSSWRDPISTHSDRDKPEIVAPGYNINTTSTASPWTGYSASGTSFSAPMVTGVSALMMQRDSSLNSWPEVIRAILMATAGHNIEGDARLSEYDGAGAIIADYADDVTRKVDGGWWALSQDCSYASRVYQITLISGNRTRVAITWDNDPAYQYYSSQPSADLDLQITDPNGVIVTGSYSYDNTFELVDFTPGSSGVYSIQVNKWRCDLSPRYLGIAWRSGTWRTNP